MSSDTFKLLSELVAIQSVFPKEKAISDFVFNFLTKIGASVHRVQAENDRDCIVATIGQASKYLCLYGHLDTVPPAEDWKQDPFKVEKNDDRVTGLGVADMKSGIAIALLSAKFAAENNLPLKVAFGVDEENVSLGSYILSQHEFFNDVDFIISGESGQIRDNNQDFAVNYGRKGRIVIEVIVKGKKAHAARSDIAVNAINKVAEFIYHLETLQFKAHQFLGTTEIIPFAISSQTDSFSIPERSTMLLNVLTVPGITSAVVIEQLEKLSKKYAISTEIRLKKREIPYMESYEVNRKDSFLQKIETNIFKRYKTHFGYAQSVADENRFATALNIPVISIGPIGGGDHTGGEWVSYSSLDKTLRVYKDILKLKQGTQ